MLNTMSEINMNLCASLAFNAIIHIVAKKNTKTRQIPLAPIAGTEMLKENSIINAYDNQYVKLFIILH